MREENGQSHDQDQAPATNLPRKGTFTDDLHQLVDNWARDAKNMMPQVIRTTPKGTLKLMMYDNSKSLKIY